MLNNLYFAYGSNLNLAQMQKRCPGARKLGIVIVDNYKLTFKANKRGVGVADIIASPGDKVVGGLYQISDQHLASLDKFEGHPNIYKRVLIYVKEADSTLKVITYIMDPKFKPKHPEQEYYGRIEKGYKDWGIPLSLLEDAVKELKKETK